MASSKNCFIDLICIEFFENITNGKFDLTLQRGTKYSGEAQGKKEGLGDGLRKGCET